MKTKLLYISCLFSFTLAFGQKKVSFADVQNSKDPRLIAQFLKDNPDHPKIDELKTKMVLILREGLPDKTAKPEVKKLSSTSLKKQIKKDLRDGVNDHNKQTERVLNHILGGDKNSNEAYVQIANHSKCNLIVKFSGKNFYNLDVPAGSQNYILVKKGNYQLTSKICGGQYSAAKKIQDDISLTLSTR